MSPFRRIVATTVAIAIAAPMIGIDFDSLRESRAPPHRATWLVTLPIHVSAANAVPHIVLLRLWITSSSSVAGLAVSTPHAR